MTTKAKAHSKSKARKDKKAYSVITYQERKDLIKDVIQNGMTRADACKKYNIKLTTGCLIVRNYQNNGRIFSPKGPSSKYGVSKCRIKNDSSQDQISDNIEQNPTIRHLSERTLSTRLARSNEANQNQEIQDLQNQNGQGIKNQQTQNSMLQNSSGLFLQPIFIEYPYLSYQWTASVFYPYQLIFLTQPTLPSLSESSQNLR